MKYEKGSRSLFTKLSISLNQGSLNQVSGVHTLCVCALTKGMKDQRESQMMILEVAAEVKCANMQPTSRQ